MKRIIANILSLNERLLVLDRFVKDNDYRTKKGHIVNVLRDKKLSKRNHNVYRYFSDSDDITYADELIEK